MDGPKTVRRRSRYDSMIRVTDLSTFIRSAGCCVTGCCSQGAANSQSIQNHHEISNILHPQNRRSACARTGRRQRNPSSVNRCILEFPNHSKRNRGDIYQHRDSLDVSNHPNAFLYGFKHYFGRKQRRCRFVSGIRWHNMVGQRNGKHARTFIGVEQRLHGKFLQCHTGYNRTVFLAGSHGSPLLHRRTDVVL